MGPTSEGRKGASKGRKETVNDGRKARTLGLASVWSSMKMTRRSLPWVRPDSDHIFHRMENEMGVLVYIVLTVLIFGVLGLVQKLVERL
jgi:hypothetical protein